MKKALEKYRNATDLNRFLVFGGVLFLLWRVFRKWMLLKGQYMDFTQLWSKAYLSIAQSVLNMLGYETTANYSERKLWLTGSAQAIEIVYDCLAVNLFFVFIIFIMAYPGRLKIKLWFIPTGLLIIFILNSLRMAALAVIAANKYHLLDLFHHFIFQGVIYVCIFIMWWFFSVLNKNTN